MLFLRFRTASVYAFLPFIFLLSCAGRPDEKGDVMQSFWEYNRTTSMRLGAEAVKLVDSGSLSYYNSLIPVITNADSVTVRYLRFDQKILVLALRHTTPKAKIKSMNGSTLFQYLVQMGMVNQDDESSLRRFRFEVSMQQDGSAGVQFIDSAGNNGVSFRFNKENDLWKIDLTSAFKYVNNEVWENMIAESGMTEDEVLYAILENIDGRKASPLIWHPMAE